VTIRGMDVNSVATSTTLPWLSVVGTTLRMFWSAKVSAASNFQVAPPTFDRARPKPPLPSKAKLLVLPVPANTTSGFTGLRATELMDKAGGGGWVGGVQEGLLAGALVFSHPPPLTAPT